MSVQRQVSLAKITCSWCYESATWEITDEFDWPEYTCTMHGQEWFPQAFAKVSLVKTADHDGHVSETTMVKRRQSKTLRPWYPLIGHREGLRANDLISLASAFFIDCLEGGRLNPVPGTYDYEGNVVPARF